MGGMDSQRDVQVNIGMRLINPSCCWWSMRFFRIRNELLEWLIILGAVTIAGLLGAGLKSWLDNVLFDTNSGWLSGVAALLVFAVIAIPAFVWVDRGSRHRSRVEGEDD